MQPSIRVMQPAEDREGDDVPLGGAVRCHWGLLAKPLMRAGAAVVADVLSDNALEVPIVEHQDVVEAFATQGTE